jgi:single-strand DNA-binding protein
MPSGQQVIIYGHLAFDPELSYTPNGTPICKFRIPVQDYWDKQNDRTAWFNFVAFKKTAERIAEHLSKGDVVLVNCKKSDSTWEDNDGNKRYSSEFLVLGIDFLKVAKWNNKAPEPNFPEPTDDVPF